MSFHWEFLPDRHTFKIADGNIPSESLKDYDEEARNVIRDFIATKKSTNAHTRIRQKSSSKIHKPLRPGETRVLELHAADLNAPFQGNLHTVSIDFTYPVSPDPGPDKATNHGVSLATELPVWYTALSYTWGPSGSDDEIHVEGETLKITSSLACALQHLRSPEHNVFLWIDQIVRPVCL
jgi:hypothetical protein